MTTTATYDPADAPYIVCGLVALFHAHMKADEKAADAMRDHFGGEVGCMERIWETAIETAQAIAKVVDFNADELGGVFAYDHLDTHEEGSLVHAIWLACILERNATALATVSLYACAKHWPMLP